MKQKGFLTLSEQSKSKGFAPIFIVIIIAALVGGYLLYQNQSKLTPPFQLITKPSPTPIDETANWKTYINKYYNFEIKYPEDATLRDISVEEVTHEPTNGLIDITLPRKTMQDFSAGLAIETENNPKLLNAQDYCLSRFKGNDLKEKKQINIGNIAAYMVKINTHIGPDEIMNCVTKGNKILILRYSLDVIENDPLVKEHSKILDLIVSTFKFLSPSPTSVDTSNWKTYTNTKYRYSFKYPPEYTIRSCVNCFDLSAVDFMTLSPLNRASTKEYGKIMISHLKDNTQNQPVDDYLNELSTIVNQPIVPGSKQQVSVNGYDELIVINRDENNDADSENVYLTNGKTGIHLSFDGDYPDENAGIRISEFKNVSIFNQILSTFRFD